MRTTAIFLFLATIAFSCDTSSGLSEDEKRSIVNAGNAQLEDAFLHQDIDKLISIYAPDARLSPNRDQFYSGHEEIRAFWAEDFKTSKLLNMHTNTLSVDGNDDIIYETGITSIESIAIDSTKFVGSVKYINVWKRQPDKSFKLAIDFWNSPKR